MEIANHKNEKCSKTHRDFSVLKCVVFLSHLTPINLVLHRWRFSCWITDYSESNCCYYYTYRTFSECFPLKLATTCTHQWHCHCIPSIMFDIIELMSCSTLNWIIQFISHVCTAHLLICTFVFSSLSMRSLFSNQKCTLMKINRRSETVKSHFVYNIPRLNMQHI